MQPHGPSLVWGYAIESIIATLSCVSRKSIRPRALASRAWSMLSIASRRLTSLKMRVSPRPISQRCRAATCVSQNQYFIKTNANSVFRHGTNDGTRPDPRRSGPGCRDRRVAVRTRSNTRAQYRTSRRQALLIGMCSKIHSAEHVEPSDVVQPVEVGSTDTDRLSG